MKETAPKKKTAKKTVRAKSAAKSAGKSAPKIEKSAPRKTAAKKTGEKAARAKSAKGRKSARKTPKAKPQTSDAGFPELKKDPTFAAVKKCWRALDDKKAEDLRILDVRGKSPITNYFIIATATSEPHMKALAGELEKTLKENGIKAVGRDYKTESGWAVIDAFDFMAHIFLPEQRGLYGIESLWKDAEEIKISS